MYRKSELTMSFCPSELKSAVGRNSERNANFVVRPVINVFKSTFYTGSREISALQPKQLHTAVKQPRIRQGKDAIVALQ